MVAMMDQTSTSQGHVRSANVNYGMNVRQPVQRIDMPNESNGQLDIDLNNIVKGVSSGIEKYKEDKITKGLNNYARDVNLIAEGVRQGKATADEAQGRLRKIDDIYLAQGYDAKELGNIRAKFDGGIYSAREAVLKEKETHEAKRQSAMCDTFRETYKSTANWSDARVMELINRTQYHADKIFALNAALSDPDLSSTDRESLSGMRNEEFERVGMANTMLQLDQRLSSGAPITEQDVATFRTGLMAEARRNGIPLEMAAVLADKMIDASGMSTIIGLQKQNSEDITAYNERIAKQMVSTAKMDMYNDFPTMVVVDAMSPELRKTWSELPSSKMLLRRMGTQLAGTYNNKTKQAEVPAKDAVPVAVDVVSNMVKTPGEYPSTVLRNGIAMTSNYTNQFTKDTYGQMETTSDVNTAHDNAVALDRKFYSNPAVIEILDSLPDEQVEEFLKNQRINTATMRWTAMSPDILLTTKKMLTSFGANRLRVNDEGLVVMADSVTGSAKGFWQTTGNIFGAAFSDIDEHLKEYNNFLTSNFESPEERAEFTKMVTGGNDIQKLGELEEAEEGEYKSLAGSMGDIGKAMGGMVADEAKNIWETDKALAKGYMNFTNKMGGYINKAIYEGYKSFDDFLQSSSINQKVIQEKQRKAFDNTVKKIDDAVRGAVNRFGEAMRGLPEDIDVKGYLKTSKDMVERGVKNALDKFTKEVLPDLQLGYKTLKEVTGYFVDDIKSGFIGEEFKRLVNDKDFKKALQDVAEEYFPMLVEPAIVNSFTDDVSKLIQEGSKDLGIIRDELKMIKKYTLPIDKANADSFIDSLVSKRVIEPIENTYLKAIIDVESAGDPSAVSKKGARGLMQIMPATWNGDIAPRLGMTMNDIDDPSLNILGGYYYFSTLRNKYKDINKTLAAYNWGQGNVDNAIELYGDQWWTKLPEETFKYLNKVNHRVRQSLGQYDMFQQERSPNGNMDLDGLDMVFDEEGPVTVESDGNYYVVPTFFKGSDGTSRQHSKEESLQHFKETGNYLHVSRGSKEAKRMEAKIKGRRK